MWKCTFCEKTNFDDQKVCPYCTAPNPAAQKTGSTGTPGHHAQPQGGATPPAQDWASRYNPDPKANKKPVKLDQILKYLVIAASALLIIYLVTMLFQKPGSKTDAAISPVPDQALIVQQTAEQETPAPTDTPVPTDTPAPTREPVVVDAVTELYLDFGQTYQCTTKDFVLPYDIANDEVTWRCADNEDGTTCTKNGTLEAGFYQVDPEMRYNEEIIVTGTTEEGSVLTYHVFTGDGETYDFTWTSGRSMKNYSGAVIACSPMVVRCSGFTLYYKYELTDGKLEANSWSVWVRENGTEWVRVQDIQVENQVAEAHDIVFDRPITFSEICVQPETYSYNYSYQDAFLIAYMIFY